MLLRGFQINFNASDQRFRTDQTGSKKSKNQKKIKKSKISKKIKQNQKVHEFRPLASD